MKRMRVRGRATVVKPGHELDGAKVDLLNRAPGGDWIVRVRDGHGSYKYGALARVKESELRIDPV